MIYGTIQKVDILAIGVHPDDIELGCSGTLLSHIAKGYTVGILDLTRGELGTRGNPELRAQEASNAARLMGASFRVILDCKDGFITFNETTCLSIIEIIRASQPTIILANAKQDRHPDHGRAAKITADAAYLSGLSQIESFHQGARQEKWRPNAVYHYLQDETENPDFVVNVSQFIDQKFAHKYYDEISLGIDFTARDLQEQLRAKGLPWEKAKAFDGSAVIGEFFPKENFDLLNLGFQLYKNDELVQNGNTRQMLWKIDEIIAYVSQYFTLKKGDIIFTGTPEGVGRVDPDDVLIGKFGEASAFKVNVK